MTDTNGQRALDDPAQLSRAARIVRAALDRKRAAELEEHVQRILAAAPPLTPDQIAHIAAALRPTPKQSDAVDSWVSDQLAEPWPLSEGQLDTLRRVLAPQSPIGAGAPVPIPRPRVSLVKPRVPRVAVYRHYDADDVLLYVGISVNPNLRGRDHARGSHWIDFAVREDALWFKNRAAATAAEAAAILSDRPIFNSSGAGPDRDERLVRYLTAHGRLDLLRSVL